MIFRRILVANRGEIAVRIIRTCERLGIETILAASEADLHSMAARMADSVICIGPASSAVSYLSVDPVVAAALAAKVDAIHPGYGFLSENPRLAAACESAGIVFIGPTVRQLEAVGDKLNARAHAIAAGLPVFPGGEVRTFDEAYQLAAQIGMPVLIKSVGGGGGRGMKLVHDSSKLASALELAMSEAQATFGDPRVYLERFAAGSRHIEVQVLGDGENVIHLGTRDCSVQRRYQKLVEEAPAPSISDRLREILHRSAVAFAKHLRYRGLGTVEFLVDGDREAFYFLEMNARIQVEHPVTEAICGLDLVEEQICIAQQARLRWKQNDIAFNGHALECRINAEDWAHDFRPSPGTISRAAFPVGPGTRVDTHIQPDAAVPAFYDSLLAKLIIHGENRAAALHELRRALVSCEIGGITTNLPMYTALLANDEYSGSPVDTAFLQRFLEHRATHAA